MLPLSPPALRNSFAGVQDASPANMAGLGRNTRHASMHGPTWPTECSSTPASIAGLDSAVQQPAEIADHGRLDRRDCPSGMARIFDALQTKGHSRRRLLWRRRSTSRLLAALKGIHLDDNPALQRLCPLISPRRTIRMVISSSNRVTTYYTITKTAPLNIPWRMRHPWRRL